MTRTAGVGEKKSSTVVPYRRSTISPALVFGNWKEITRRKESNNTHSPRFTYVRARPAPSAAIPCPTVRAGFDRKSHIAFYWVGYILPTGLFLLCSFLWLFSFPLPTHPSTPQRFPVIWIQSKGSVLSNVHFVSVRVKGAVRPSGHRRRHRRRRFRLRIRTYTHYTHTHTHTPTAHPHTNVYTDARVCVSVWGSFLRQRPLYIYIICTVSMVKRHTFETMTRKQQRRRREKKQ